MKSSIALAALVVAVLGASAVPAFAQDTAPAVAAPTAAPVADKAGHGPRQMQHRMDRNGGGMRLTPRFLGLVCSDRGSERLEIALVRLSHRLDLTADQQKLFETFRTTVLTTQTSYADSCKVALENGAKPGLLEGLKAGIEIEQARLTALGKILPDFEAFYASLSEDQLARLMPHRADMHRGPGEHGDHGGMFRLGPPHGNR